MKLPGSLVVGAVIGLVFGVAATAFVFNGADSGAGGGASAGVANPGAGRGGPPRGRGGYAPAVTIVVAREASLGKTLDVIGEARALKSVSLTSEATGIVSSVNVAPGKRVSAGDVLLTLDDEQQRIALDRARAQFPIAKENSDRYASLQETEAASALEAEAAFNNYKAIEADLRAAQFAVQQRKIVAPFDGVIGLTTIEAGDYLRAGDMVTTLDDTSSIVIEFSVPQEAAAAVEPGQAVRARLASGFSGAGLYEGWVSAIDSRVDPVSRTLRIEATFDNFDSGLLPGAIFAVSTTSAGALAVSVPGLAIQWDRSGAYVWKRGEDGAAIRAAVEILQRTDQIVLVDGDLNPGDAVVSEGSDRVRPGIVLPEPVERGEGRQVRDGAGAAAAGVSAPAGSTTR